MAPYIFGKRSTIHIIDIRETVKGLLRARKFLAQAVARGEDVLFVGTKRQARQHIKQQAQRVKMPFVAERWLGGTLTNFRTIRSRLARLEELEAAEADRTALEFSKKMIASRQRELRKIKRNLDGIREMNKLPGALIVVDVHRERNAVREAKKLRIPTICLIDTDSDPDYVDLPIPGNDDAMRAIELVLVQLADAIELGFKGRLSASTSDEEAAISRKRSRRPTTARADEGPSEVAGTAGAEVPAEVAPTGLGQSESSTVDEAPPPAPEAGLTPATASDPEASA